MTLASSPIKNGITTIALILAIFFSQHAYDQHKPADPIPTFVVLSADIIKMVDLGLHSAAASLAWLSVIQNVTSSRGNLIDKELLVVTQLDPRFSYPYAFGVIMLPAFLMPDKAIELGKLGLANAEPDWRIPYYMAAVYHEYYHDSTNAEKYFAISAGMPDAPTSAKYLAASYGAKTSRREQTRAIWKGIYETSNDEVASARALAYLEHFDILDILDRAAAIYKKQTGRIPATVDDLIAAHILKAQPHNSLGLAYSFNDNGEVQVNLQQ